MPKQLLIDPALTRQRMLLPLRDIPVHAYETPLAAERAAVGDDRLLRMLRDMLLIREFETMLAGFKGQGAYAGIKHIYAGPAHLSIGQEAVAVGSAAAFDIDDHVFGSHRSHGEFIAKGLSSIARLSGDALAAMMAAQGEGRLLHTLEARIPTNDITERAEQFLLFGLLTEILMRANGFNGGMGGSMHAFFPPLGIYPNNAIVGGSAGIAAGAALYKKLRRAPGIAVANIGDGSTGCGPVWEAMNLAGMAQLTRLWDEAHRGGLPVLFLFHNNFYAMGGQTNGETAAWDRLSRIGAGINAAAMHAETVDGTNPLAVLDAVRRKRDLLLAGQGPALIDAECYRFVGHSTTDASAYRTKEEIEGWRSLDPIISFAAQLKTAGVLDDEAEAAMIARVKQTIQQITALSVDPEASPPIDIRRDPLAVGRLMFKNEMPLLAETGAGELVQPAETCSRVVQLAKRSRVGRSPEGKRLSAMAAITIRDSLFETILHHVRHDASLIVYGEENREWGGAFGVYRGLSEILPYHRLFNAPISEAATIASAVGYALEGGRALVELMYADFIGRAGDEIFNQMAKWQSMSGGVLRMPLVLRCSIGSKYGAQHSQDWTALVAHIPGLKVVYPATPYDAKGLMAAALSGHDPVVFFESQRLYDTTELFQPEGVPADYYQIPLGIPDIKRAGADVTILTIGPSLYKAIDAAATLETEHGISAEVIDARSLVPFDYEMVLASVAKTHRLLLVSEACERGSMLMTLATNMQRFAFTSLEAPVRVLGAPNWIVPGADLEASYFPQADDIIDIVCNDLIPGKARPATGNRGWDSLELARMGL
jgi:2-oxoisovalerate dehydrogenase E1 component